MDCQWQQKSRKSCWVMLIKTAARLNACKNTLLCTRKISTWFNFMSSCRCFLPYLVQTRNSLRRDQPAITKVTSVRNIANVLTEVEVGKAMLPDVAAIVKIYYTLPVATATGERSFSPLRRLKTFLRSTMTQPRLNSAMLLHVHKDRCDRLDVMSMAKLFISANDRRQHFFCSFD